MVRSRSVGQWISWCLLRVFVSVDSFYNKFTIIQHSGKCYVDTELARDLYLSMSELDHTPSSSPFPIWRLKM